jgi:probable HAF family extracellular repeat protein
MTFLRSFAFALLPLLCIPLCAQITFTTIDVPGAAVTSVRGINTTGDMVGYYAETSNGPTHAFLLRDGIFTFLDYPGATYTRAMGINDSGQIVGYAVKGDAAAIGFRYDGSTFTAIRVPSRSATFTWGINNGADIVGGAGTFGATRGFELHASRFKDISPPGNYIYIYGTGINNFGKIVGWTSGVNVNGFAYKRGSFQTISFPGSSMTEAWGINDSGVIVGWYQQGSFFYGFTLINGKYTSFSYPGAKGTFPAGINAAGQIVGSYTLDYNVEHGFVTSPVN